MSFLVEKGGTGSDRGMRGSTAGWRICGEEGQQ